MAATAKLTQLYALFRLPEFDVRYHAIAQACAVCSPRNGVNERYEDVTPIALVKHARTIRFCARTCREVFKDQLSQPFL
jgi:hypothetical protein